MAEQMRMMAKTVKKKSPDEKEYLICIKGKDGAEDSWDIVIGRDEAYTYIKDSIEFIDLEESFILVDECKMSERKSIVVFMRYVERFYEDNFDINDYVKGDDESLINNDIEDGEPDSIFLQENNSVSVFANQEYNSIDIE